MRLHLEGVAQSGVSMLDLGVKDIETAVIDGVIHVYSTTGRNGGLVEYVLGEDGQLQPVDTVIFPPEVTGGVSEDLVLTIRDGVPILLLGAGDSGLWGLGLGTDGFGARLDMVWQAVQDGVNAGDFTLAEALILLSPTVPGILPEGVDLSGIADLEAVSVAGNQFLIGACASRNTITVLMQDDETGGFAEVNVFGAAQGLGIDAPTALEVVQTPYGTFVIVGAAGTSSISMMRLRADGSLEPTDHVIDNGTTRFEGLQSMAVGVSGDHVFVVAGGADNGLTLFLMLPDGSLVHLQTFGDTDETSLHKVSSIEVVVEGDTLHVFVGSQNEGGLTHLTIDLGSLGSLRMGTPAADVLWGGAGDDILMGIGSFDRLFGGGGDDVLIATSNQTVMSGGLGSDMFVIRDGSGTTHIVDFERAIDKLDLSDLPMLRDLSQLVVITTETGARIEYRGHVLLITASDGRPLSASDLFPDGLVGGDHFEFVPPEEYGIPGEEIIGTDGQDRLKGTENNDTIVGSGGGDTVLGGGGNDWIQGSYGGDRLYGGSGDDTVDGGIGRDRIFGGDGSDLILGGNGGDFLAGSDGDDTIEGGAGDDRIYGGSGNDLLISGDGKGWIYGGPGDDHAIGGDDNDTFFLSHGNDLIEAGDGDDRAYGGIGDDLIDGGNGHDFLGAGKGNDTVFGGNGNDTINGGKDDDWLYGDGGNDWISSGRGNDSADGGAGHDALLGEGGHDTLNGGAGNDWLSGGDGDDLLYGDDGDDIFRGGSGSDTFWGGRGADAFEFFGNHDTGRIMDFNPSEGDVLRIEDAIWYRQGYLAPETLVETYASIDAQGNIVLDLTEIGGCVIILQGYDDLAGLIGAIEYL